ncbi:MAG: SRPBCC family protein [Vicinamibacterales bacterium]
MASSTDRIEKRAVLKAPRSRVWRAIADSTEFGTWFRMVFDGPFVEGKSVRGRVTYPGYEHVEGDFQIERIQPETYFAYRWHPYAVDPDVDYSGEPTTLVEFRLEDAGTHTVLTLVESGFDQIPAHRRAEAYRMNEGGWTGQVANITAHVETA